MIVYLTTNLINGKQYVGCSRNPRRGYLGSGKLIKAAIKKHGSKNFIRETLETCSGVYELEECEMKWIEHFNAVEDKNFYNLHKGGYVPCAWNLGIPRTDVERKLISIKTKENAPKGKTHYRTGTRRPDIERMKMSENRRGKLTGVANHKARAIRVYFDDKYKDYDCVKNASKELEINNNTMRTLTTSGKYSEKYNIRIEKL